MSVSVPIAAPRAKRPFSLTHAVVGSLLLHLVLMVLLSLLRSLGGPSDSALIPAESDELTFTFATASADDEATEEGRKKGLIPTEESFEGESAVPLTPSTLSQPSPQSEPTPANPAREATAESLPPQFGSPDEAPLTPLEPIDEPPLDEPEQEVENSEPEPIEEQRRPDPVDPFETEGRQPIMPQRRPTARVVPLPQGNRSEPTLSERLDNFGEAIERFRAANPPRPSGPPTNVIQPDWSQIPSTGQAIGSLRFESIDYDWGDYGRQIYWIIWRSWHNRLLERADEFERWAQQNQIYLLDHFNGVQFTIERNGEVTGILIELESGCVPLDFSSTEALAEAVLPPLPADFPRNRETVHVTFSADGPIAPMRRSLRYLKQRGLF